MEENTRVDATNIDDGKVEYNTQLDTLDENEPTEEESRTLKRVSDTIPLAAWLIVICELCERFAYYGLSGPFQNYIEFPIPGPNNTQPGALGRGQMTATALKMFFQFFSYLTPIAGAILADQYWGKYKMIMISCGIYMVGLLVLVLTSIPPAIDAGVAFPGLIVAMIIVGLGTGGVKSNVSPLMAQQYTKTKLFVKTINGERKIVDPSLTVQSMFNWFYWAINLGALSAIITTNVEKYHSFWLSYLIPLIVFNGAIIVLVIGRNKYVQAPPTGSLLVRAGRLVAKAIRIRSKFGKRSDRHHILDYAIDDPTPTIKDSQATITELSDEQFIDDLKKASRACRVFLFYPFYWVCYNQFGSNLVSQAAQMNVGPLPNDILQNIDPLVLIIFIPIFDKIIYPGLRRLKINFPSIPRISFGFFFVALGMAWSAIVQHLIYRTEPNYNFAVEPCSNCQQFNNITVAWQIPAYFFIAISEIFASITGLEYAFTQAPSSMKSIVMSLFLFTSAIGSILNIILIPVTKNPDILWMYASLAIVAAVTGIIFYLIFRESEKVHPEPSPTP